MKKDAGMGVCLAYTDQQIAAKTEVFCGMLLVVETALSHLLDSLIRKGVMVAEEEAAWVVAIRETLNATQDKRSAGGQRGVETLLDCLESRLPRRMSSVTQSNVAHIITGRFQVIPGGLSGCTYRRRLDSDEDGNRTVPNETLVGPLPLTIRTAVRQAE